jgi:hypothetical protein
MGRTNGDAEEARWAQQIAAVVGGVRGWRTAHPRATLREIAAAIEAELSPPRVHRLAEAAGDADGQRASRPAAQAGWGDGPAGPPSGPLPGGPPWLPRGIAAPGAPPRPARLRPLRHRSRRPPRCRPHPSPSRPRQPDRLPAASSTVARPLPIPGANPAFAHDTGSYSLQQPEGHPRGVRGRVSVWTYPCRQKCQKSESQTFSGRRTKGIREPGVDPGNV